MMSEVDKLLADLHRAVLLLAESTDTLRRWADDPGAAPPHLSTWAAGADSWAGLAWSVANELTSAATAARNAATKADRAAQP